MNQALAKYYIQKKDNCYYVTDKRGKFLAWFEQHGFDDNDIEDELLSYDPHDCSDFV